METVERTYGSASYTEKLPTPKPGSVGEIISNAMGYLDRYGWCQFVARNNKGEACGHGSVNEAAFAEYEKLPDYIKVETPLGVMTLMEDANSIPATANQPVPNVEKKRFYSSIVEAHRFLIQAAVSEGWHCENGTLIDEMLGNPYKDPFGVFNDHPNTTVEDVKMMMKKAIDLADEAGM